MQTVKGASFAIKPIFDDIVELRIAALKMPEHSVGNEISELDEARGLGVQEQRHFREISENAPAMSHSTKVSRQALNGGLVSGLVEHDYAALGIARSVQSHQKLVESTRNLLERVLDRVPRRNCRGFNNGRKNPIVASTVRKNLQRVKHGANSIRNWKSVPAVATLPHRAAMQFNRFRRSGIEPLSDAVQFGRDPISLSLEY